MPINDELSTLMIIKMKKKKEDLEADQVEGADTQRPI